ncbi:twin-arginine translocation signal domain-containing protein [Selenomonas ruminantium]|uniref:Tat (Twin-arginine translocation) pathway signal sequence n=1 Tax=Selenomonas ruminantium TaxID=971 RepID=A0A1H3Y5S8_SELRU|nr:twin-arginine translocation signal domain-containing protein [Selenomonas ruminantium]SEA06943.1 Tat (twin-arginine translocation) pathway signal sequence [Selenomonas ruminantium]
MEKSFSIPISRRAFMKLVGMGTVGVLAETAMPSGPGRSEWRRPAYFADC